MDLRVLVALKKMNPDLATSIAEGGAENLEANGKDFTENSLETKLSLEEMVQRINQRFASKLALNYEKKLDAKECCGQAPGLPAAPNSARRTPSVDIKTYSRSQSAAARHSVKPSIKRQLLMTLGKLSSSQQLNSSKRCLSGAGAHVGSTSVANPSKKCGPGIFPCPRSGCVYRCKSLKLLKEHLSDNACFLEVEVTNLKSVAS